MTFHRYRKYSVPLNLIILGQKLDELFQTVNRLERKIDQHLAKKVRFIQ